MNKNQNWRKVLSLLCVMIMVICIAVVGTIASSAEEASVITSDVTWNDGDVIDATTISGGTEDAPLVITVNGTVTINGTLRLSSAAISNVRFVAGTEGATLIRAKGFAGQMLYAEGVSGNFHNITFEGITLDGGAKWTGEKNENLGRGTVNTGNKATGSVLYLVYTNVTLENSVLQNHDDSTGEKSNAVFLRYYSTITFNNSVVRNNASPSGYYSGGVITVRQGGTAKTYNSKVYGNYGVQGGFFGVSSTGSYGGICEVYDSVFYNNFANQGALFDMQCNSNKGYLLIDGCEFYDNGSNRGLIYEHAYTRPVIIKDSTFRNNECAIWDCNADPTLDLSGKIVIEGDYEGYFFETPLAISAPLTEGSHIEMSKATVNKLMASGYLLTGAAGYQVTEADLAKLTLPEDYELVVADVNGDGIGDTVSVAPDQADSLTPVYITIKDTFDKAAKAQSVVYTNISCLPVCSFAHKGFTFAGWVDADGNAVAKQMFSESTTLFATWKIETPVVKLSRVDATLSATVSNNYDSLTYTYQWYMDNEAIAGATASTYTMTDVTSHSYKCEVTATFGEYSASASVSGTFSAPAAAQIGDVKYATLKDALTAANALESATITLYKNVTLGEKLTVSGNVTISGAYTITRADSYTGTLFVVSAGATLTLDGGLVIDGGNNYVFDKEAYMEDAKNRTRISSADSTKWFTPVEGAPVASAFMITTEGGTVNLNNVTIQNNYSTASGIVSARANSTINFNGAVITHNAITANSGLAANVSGANIFVNVNEGTKIDGNHVGGNHGIFKVYSGATLTMNGGEITNNTGWNSNGVVIGIFGASVYMKGGLICSNTGVYGPNNGRNAAIYGHSGHTFVMTGGTICHNAGGYGGLDAPYANGTTEIHGGAIVDNVSYSNNNYPDVNASNQLVITGGTFTQDVSKWLSKDTGLVYVNGVYTTYSYVDYLKEVKAKLEAGESVVLDRDIVITDYSFVHVCKLPSNSNGKYGLDAGNGAIFHITKPDVVLDLNGHSIIWDAHDEAYCNKRQVSLFLVTGTGYAGETASFTVTDRVGTGKVDIYGMPSAMYVVLSTAKATVEGGTWTNYPCATCKACNIFMYPSHGGALYITGGAFEQKVDDPYLLYAVLSSTPTNGNSVGVDYDQTKVVISGGTFVGTNPADIKFADTAGKITKYNACKEGFAPQQNANGTWGVVTGVAKIGNVYYASLQEAINACKNGETVKLLVDLELTDKDVVYAHGGATGFGDYDKYNPTLFYVGGTKGATASQNKPSDVNVVIDLNGHSITSTADAYLFIFMDNCKVTLKDSVGGGMLYTKAEAPVVWVVGTETLVTVESGYYLTDSTSGLMHSTHAGDLVIKGGEFKTTADNASLLIMLNTKDRGNSKYFIKGVATVTIKGGIFHGFNPAKVGDDNGATSVDDIKFVDGCEEGFCPVLNENGTYGVAKELTFKGVRLLLKDGIGIYFMLKTADLVENDYVAVFTFGGKTVEVSFKDWKHFADGVNTGILFDDIVAKSIATEVSVVIYSKGMAVSETQKISVKAYAQAILAGDKYTAEAKALAQALLNYGALAENAFASPENKTDVVEVNKNVNDQFTKLDTDTKMDSSKVSNSVYYGSSVNVESYLGFNFKFRAEAAKGATYAVITYGENEVKVNITFDDDNGLAIVTLNGLKASEADLALTCTLYDDNGTKIATATDSVYNYCARALAGLDKMDETTYGKQNFKSEFYKSLVLYIEAAKNYAEVIKE